MGAEIGVEGEVIASVLAIFVCLPIITFTIYYFLCTKCCKSNSNAKNDLQFPAYISPADAAISGSPLPPPNQQAIIRTPTNHNRPAPSSSASTNSASIHEIQQGSPASPSLRKNLFSGASAKVSPAPAAQNQPMDQHFDVEGGRPKGEQGEPVIFTQEGMTPFDAKSQAGSKAWHKAGKSQRRSRKGAITMSITFSR